MPRDLDLANRIKAAIMLGCRLVVQSQSEAVELREIARRPELPMPKIVYRDLPERTSDAAA